MTLDTEHPLSVLTSVPKLRVYWTNEGEDRVIFGTLQGTEISRLLFWPSRDDANDLRPQPGQMVTIEAPTEQGIFEIPAQIIPTDLLGCVSLTLAGKMRRIQRRQFVRVQIDGVCIQGWLLDDFSSPVEALTVSLMDLSGGGVRFSTHIPLEAGYRLRLPLSLIGEPLLVPEVAIVDSFVDSSGAGTRHVNRGYFRDIREPDRERVVQFVMREQLTQRRRHLPD